MKAETDGMVAAPAGAWQRWCLGACSVILGLAVLAGVLLSRVSARDSCTNVPPTLEDRIHDLTAGVDSGKRRAAMDIGNMLLYTDDREELLTGVRALGRSAVDDPDAQVRSECVHSLDILLWRLETKGRSDLYLAVAAVAQPYLRRATEDEADVVADESRWALEYIQKQLATRSRAGQGTRNGEGKP